MEKLHTSIFINAPKEKVWDTMLGDATYRQWTSAFHEGSYYKGDWEEGSKILFLGPADQDGEGEGGMVSRIKENRKHEFISIEHLGIVKDGIEDTTSEEARKWTPSYENYTIIEKDGGTEVTIDMEVDGMMSAEFEGMWTAALRELKELAEQA